MIYLTTFLDNINYLKPDTGYLNQLLDLETLGLYERWGKTVREKSPYFTTERGMTINIGNREQAIAHWTPNLAVAKFDCGTKDDEVLEHVQMSVQIGNYPYGRLYAPVPFDGEMIHELTSEMSAYPVECPVRTTPLHHLYRSLIKHDMEDMLYDVQTKGVGSWIIYNKEYLLDSALRFNSLKSLNFLLKKLKCLDSPYLEDSTASAIISVALDNRDINLIHSIKDVGYLYHLFMDAIIKKDNSTFKFLLDEYTKEHYTPRVLSSLATDLVSSDGREIYYLDKLKIIVDYLNSKGHSLPPIVAQATKNMTYQCINQVANNI